MEYQEFVCAVIGELNLKLKGGAKASLHTAVKNNGKERKGALIEIPGINISPTIYLEEFYEQFEDGDSMKEVIGDILEFYEKVKCVKSWDASWLTEYEKVREKIVLRMINTKGNVQLLQKVPHCELLDLSIVFHVLLEIDCRGTTMLLIDENMMEKWGVNSEILYRDALSNTTRLFQAHLIPITDVMEELLCGKKELPNLLEDKREEERQDIMYVLTNKKRNFGAACILYPDVLENIGEILGEDYYVLPSSIHEMVIVPMSQGREIDEMDDMIKEINAAEVAEEEVLSDHTYFYERKTKRLGMKQHVSVKKRQK